MANFENHAPGSFCWIELATTDQPAAKKFYSDLLGWTATDSPMGPDGVYTIFKLNGRDAGAAYTMHQEQRQQGVPPNWALYIATDNADQTAAQTAKLGGTVLAPAFDVVTFGRMAVLQDPTAAIFCLWQSKQSHGLGVKNENNSFCWADLSTGDPRRASEFYTSLFGWEINKGEGDDYLHIKNGEDFIGGIPPAQHRNPNVPAHWLIYFQVANVEGTTEKVKQLGGAIHMPARHMENVGTFSIVADPQGATFALFKSAR
jgi:predicted enzyme related to lactoylglutathione lyase